jgi:hypothetical protein
VAKHWSRKRGKSAESVQTFAGYGRVCQTFPVRQTAWSIRHTQIARRQCLRHESCSQSTDETTTTVTLPICQTNQAAMRPRSVRSIIQQTFARLTSEQCVITEESLLIRNGHYCGQRFQSGPLTAVWFLEEDQIKFHAGDGSLLLVVKPSESDQAHSRVA